MRMRELEGVEVGDVWYRIEDRRFAGGVDEFGDPSGPAQSGLTVQRHAIQAVNRKTVRLAGGRLVRVGVKRQYAWPTVDEAVKDFIRRKEIQRHILESRVRHIDGCLHVARSVPIDGTSGTIYVDAIHRLKAQMRRDEETRR